MNQDSLAEMSMDANNLYKEDTYTDQKVGTLRMMTPVTLEGLPDPARRVQFVGQTQVLTPAGALPLNFELDAENLSQALELFAAGAQQAMEKTMQEIKEYQRQQASSIVLPGGEQGGRSKIQFP